MESKRPLLSMRNGYCIVNRGNNDDRTNGNTYSDIRRLHYQRGGFSECIFREEKKLKPLTAAAVRTKTSYVQNNSHSFPRSFITYKHAHTYTTHIHIYTHTHMCTYITREPPFWFQTSEGLLWRRWETVHTYYMYTMRDYVNKLLLCNAHKSCKNKRMFTLSCGGSGGACVLRACVSMEQKKIRYHDFFRFVFSSYLEKDLEGTI